MAVTQTRGLRRARKLRVLRMLSAETPSRSRRAVSNDASPQSVPTAKATVRPALSAYHVTDFGAIRRVE
jgi:hypothetical protein